MKSLSIINKYVLGIGAALLVLLALAIGVTFSAITADAQSNKCKVTADVPSIGKKIKADHKWTQKNGRAYIVAVVHGKGCKMPVSVASWKAPSANGRPYSQQVLFRGHSKTIKEGRHLLSVDVPSCYFQVDLANGLNPRGHGNGAPDYHGVFIAGAKGGNKPCKQPVAACENINVQKLSRTQFTVSAQASAQNGAKIKGYVFTITKNGQVVGTKKIMTHKRNVQFSYTQNQPGTYTATVVVKTSEGKKRSPNCTENFTVTKRPVIPGRVDVCDPTTGEIINVPEADADKYLPVDSPECKEVTVCDPSTGEIINVPFKDQGNYDPTNSDACKDSDFTGTTPEELPTTGPADAVAQIVGVASLVGSTAYYAASRRALGL